MKLSNQFKYKAILLGGVTVTLAAFAACGSDGDVNPLATPDNSTSNTTPSGDDASSQKQESDASSQEESDASNPDASSPDGSVDSSTPPVPASLTWSLDPDVTAQPAQINVGTAIGAGAGGTPFTLTYLAQDPKNTQNTANPFLSTGNVPDPAYGLCDYSGASPTRVDYSTTSKFVAPPEDPMVPMAPFYFPLVYTSLNTPSSNTGTGTATPLIGLFDWRPKDIDEALVAAESDDNGKTWYFMQTVFDLYPGDSVCPSTVTGTNSGKSADNGWGHAAIIQLPGTSTADGQMLYMLNRADGHIDSDPLYVISLPYSSNKFPIWNTNKTPTNIASINDALTGAATSPNPLIVQQTTGLLHPDGIMAVVPNTDPLKPTTILYVEKILNGDDTGTTAMPAANQCKAAPFSGKTNHDISNVRLATTTDGVHFTDQGIVTGLNDPTTVDYNGTRWISPRGTLIDINGDGSLWGLLFSGGNCLDGDSDAFHYIGYAESTDLKNWTVYHDINSPIASINSITTKNQLDGTSVTIPANKPLIPTQDWFAQRVYAPSAVQIDPTHLSVTFAGYAVQTPNTNLLNYRQIGNVVLTASKVLPKGPNNINNQ
ncbi:MAG: hypothetical protein FWD73_12140 [Polyangiaceae bacterium]|nr:hypothetical protein [Polyangiaceae bacterium]